MAKTALLGRNGNELYKRYRVWLLAMHVSNALSGETIMSEWIDVSEDDEIDKFFLTLAAKQQPLGPEFEQIIQDHIWELYVE